MPRNSRVYENVKDFDITHMRGPASGGPPDPNLSKIPQWARRGKIEDPQFVTVAEATHMRDDDYVTGLFYKGVAKAYPFWVVDYYHVVHDVIEDEPYVLYS